MFSQVIQCDVQSSVSVKSSSFLLVRIDLTFVFQISADYRLITDEIIAVAEREAKSEVRSKRVCFSNDYNLD